MEMFNRVENNDYHIDSGMDVFDKFIEKSGMDKKSYQYDGVKWLLQNELQGCGGIVADEMGLGKTIMMVGLCLANFIPNRKILIVLPPLLIEQWYTQIYKTTRHKCTIYHGKNKKKIDENVGLGSGSVGSGSDPFANSLIVLSSYDAISIFRKKKSKKGFNDENKQSNKLVENSLLHKVKWGRIIFDEAHHLRNKNTSRYVGAKMLESDIKWLVSGTPIQNKKQDFYALCSLINLPASYYTDPDNFNEIASKFILKRTKKEVGIDLLDTLQKKNVVAWKSESELKFSQEIHSLIHFTNVKMREGDSGGFNNQSSQSSQSLLPLLLKARQSCIYPKMVKGQGGQNNMVNSSSKLDSVVGAILARKENGNGKLVFCHFKEEMNEIASRLRVEGGLNVGILDGKITRAARDKLLKDDNKDVLILQIQTGCEGLNLQENYSEVYFVSPHWNPYVEDQAIGRCHRIGQKKTVFVWRFEMDGFDSSEFTGAKNLEEYVVDIQNMKRTIVEQIIL
jgi:SNF2 family DNA or RNA helicase